MSTTVEPARDAQGVAAPGDSKLAELSALLEPEPESEGEAAGASPPPLSMPDSDSATPVVTSSTDFYAGTDESGGQALPSLGERERQASQTLNDSGPEFGSLATGEVGPRRLRAARWPTFPRALVRQYARGVVSFIMARPLGQRLLLIAAPIVVVGSLLIWVVASPGGGPKDGYLTERQVLWGGPGESGVYVSSAQLERGDHVMAYDRVGDYVLVRDDMGRAGYVVATQVIAHPPAVIPGQPFAGCWQSPLDGGPEACQARAQRQFASCRESCDAEATTSGAACLDHCQERFSGCLEACAGLPGAVVVSPPDPALNDQAAPAAEANAPAQDTATAAQATDADGTEVAKKKTPKKVVKKQSKKKRRARR